jgi:pyruvate dehydrogenase E2 component (dihydrolipoamide acetyltransferase)
LLSVEDVADTTAAPKKAPAPPPAPKPTVERISRPAQAAQSVEPAAGEHVAEEQLPNRPEIEGIPAAAAPSIRKMARDLGIDLSRVRGSARGGRILMEDVRAYIQRLQRMAAEPRVAAVTAAAPAPAAAKPPSPSIDFSKWGPVTKKPASQLRQVIARRMSESWAAVPRVTQFDDADITELNALRKKYATAYEKQGTRLTLTSLVVKAVVDTLKKHPLFNSSLDEAAQEVVYKDYYHIGIAVDTEAGLLVPVIRDADKKSVLEISKALEDLAARARDRKIGAEEMKGGTFTISNQGGIGGAHFTPVVNLPEVAILGLGRGGMKAAVKGDKIEARLMMPMGLSYDHRVIDGGTAARFTVDLVKAFETFNEQDVKL